MSHSSPLPPPDYERTDGLPRPILFTGIGIALGLGLVLAASAWVDRAPGRGAALLRTNGPEFSFEHAPAERTSIERDWIEQDRRVHERLETYGWVDRGAGVVRIPIARAMEKLAHETPPTAQPGKPQ